MFFLNKYFVLSPMMKMYVFGLQLFSLLQALGNELCSLKDPEKLSLHCYGPTCGMIFEVKSFGCECTFNDITTYSTTCDPATNTLNVFFYWKPPATCRGGNISLPPPLIGVPCNQACHPGELLNINTDSDGIVRWICTQCSAGRFSLGGGIRFEPPWFHLPPQFDTECSYWQNEKKRSKHPCQSWKATQSYLDSGENFHNMDAMTRLWFNIDLAVKGSVSFSYKYDAEEGFERFYFEIDGSVQMDINEIQKEWRQVRFDLSAGHHLLQWVYQKDDMISKGKDKVFIQSIEIMGVRQNDLKCTLCSPGQYSDTDGSHQCAMCSPGRYAAGYGSTYCKSCHAWEKSKEGSAKCSPSLECTDFDLAVYATPCTKNDYTNISYAWLLPKECADNGHMVIPSPVSKPCELHCKAGQYMVDKPFQKCVACAPGFAGGSLSSCKSCSAGTGSGKFMRYTEHWEIGDISDILNWKKNPDTTCVLWAIKCGTRSGIDCRLGERYDTPIQCAHECALKSWCTQFLHGIDNSECWLMSKCHEVAKSLFYDRYIQPGQFAEHSPFSTHCYGDCATSGWRSGGQFVDSGAGHGPLAESSLVMQFDPRSDPVPEFLFFTYMLSCKKKSAFLLLFFDGIQVSKFECRKDCNQTKRYASVTLPKHTRVVDIFHTIRWTYQKVFGGEIHHRCDSARIYNITTRGYNAVEFNGLASGGSQCEECSPGFYSDNPGECYPCPPGKFSNEQQNTHCKVCQDNSFTHRSGMSSCIQCGNFTHVNTDHTQCINECKFAYNPIFGTNNVSYDLISLSDQILGPIHSLHNKSLVYYISICEPFSKILKSPPECHDLVDTGWKMHHAKWEGHSYYHPISFPIFACVVHQHVFTEAANAGAVVAFYPLANTSVVGFQMSITHGAKLQCRNDIGKITTKIINVVIQFICSDDEQKQPVEVSPVIKPISDIFLVPCRIIFKWKSLYGCPLCQPSDYIWTESICNSITFTKKRIYHWKEPKICRRGIELPPVLLIKNCEVLISSPDVYIFPIIYIWAIVFGIFALVVFGGTIIFVLWLKNRKIYSKYRRLQVDMELVERGEEMEEHTSYNLSSEEENTSDISELSNF